jgi:hypothetical protein
VRDPHGLIGEVGPDRLAICSRLHAAAHRRPARRSRRRPIHRTLGPANRLQRRYERSETVIEAFFGLADAIITVRRLIRESWTLPMGHPPRQTPLNNRLSARAPDLPQRGHRDVPHGGVVSANRKQRGSSRRKIRITPFERSTHGFRHALQDGRRGG